MAKFIFVRTILSSAHHNSTPGLKFSMNIIRMVASKLILVKLMYFRYGLCLEV